MTAATAAATTLPMMDRMRMPSFPAESFFHYEVVDPLPTVARLKKMSDSGYETFFEEDDGRSQRGYRCTQKNTAKKVYTDVTEADVSGANLRRIIMKASCRILRYAYYDAYVVDWLPCVHQL